MEILGIDVGGSGIKGAIVNTETGEFVGERHRIETPQPAMPADIAYTIREIAQHFNWKGKIGCGFPAVIQHGVIKTASNIHKSCIGVNAEDLFSKATNCDVKVFNDADSAAFAELKFGGARGNNGVVLVITVGTGIGTAFFNNGQLIPNTELGHIYMPNGKKAEHYTSDAVRKKHSLSWEEWGERFNEYLSYMEKLFYPDLIILGGGASKKFAKFSDHLNIQTPIKPAVLLNQAGIIGAAMLSLN